jgi:hypothetical protein
VTERTTKTAQAGTQATARDLPPPAGGGWQRLGKNISAGVAIMGFLAGGTLSALSYLKADSVGHAQATADPGLTVYDAPQTDAQAAFSLYNYAKTGYAIGAVGVVAAIVFKILEPSQPSASALRIVPATNGLAVEF